MAAKETRSVIKVNGVTIACAREVLILVAHVQGLEERVSDFGIRNMELEIGTWKVLDKNFFRTRIGVDFSSFRGCW